MLFLLQMMAQWNTTFHGVPWGAQHSMLCEMEKLTIIWPRQPQQDFIMPPNIWTHWRPQSPNFCKIFCQTSAVLTCRKCTVCQCSWWCMQGISLLITPATIWSPIYPNLSMSLVRDSGVFIFLTQILIWSYSVAVQEKELHACTCMHAHTRLSNIDQQIQLCHVLSSFFTKDCKQSQSNFELMWKKWSP